MATSQSSKDALFESIEAAAKSLKEDYAATVSAPGLRDLAYAWRALVGGSQPGGVIVEK